MQVTQNSSGTSSHLNLHKLSVIGFNSVSESGLLGRILLLRQWTWRYFHMKIDFSRPAEIYNTKL